MACSNSMRFPCAEASKGRHIREIPESRARNFPGKAGDGASDVFLLIDSKCPCCTKAWEVYSPEDCYFVSQVVYSRDSIRESPAHIMNPLLCG